MRRTDKLVILKNAFANVARGGANAIVTIALPPVLTRAMTAESYGAWALILQLSAYVGYFDFGLQSAVGRFVAHCNERGDHNHRDSIVSTSTVALTAAGLLSFLVLAALAFLFPEMLHKMSAGLRSQARIALLLVSGSLALGLPASVLHGIFVGLQRNEIAAYIIGGSRLIGAAALVFTVLQGKGLIIMAVALALVNVASYGVAYFTSQKVAPDIRFERKLIKFSVAKELFDYCYSLTIWSFGMLLVTGLDLVFVAIFQYSAVPYYAVAAGLVTFLVGFQNAIFTAMMPAAAVLHARGDSDSLGRLLIRSSRYGTFLLVFTGLPLMLFAMPILRIWVGQAYATQASRYLFILVLANIIRLFLTPYAVTLIGTGQQRLIILSPLAEGFTNLAGGIVLGYFLGAIGIAYSTLLGAVVGVLINLFYNMPRTTDIKFRILDYLKDALLRPITFTIPLVCGCVLVRIIDVNDFAKIVITSSAVAVSAMVLWFHGLISDERAQLLGFLRITPG